MVDSWWTTRPSMTSVLLVAPRMTSSHSPNNWRK
jgi:hypothetical protein